MVDIEADGPIPGDYSMVALGAVVVEPGLSRTFKAVFRPISDKWVPEALAVSGFTREQTLTFPYAIDGIMAFRDWVEDATGKDKARFVSDNSAFDPMFVYWYMHHFTGGNPFGHSSTSLGSLWKGLARDTRSKEYKKFRRTRHTHYPLDDAMGNAEAMLCMVEKHGLRMGM
jgi:hypothetical protein